MDTTVKTIQNNALASMAARAPQHVLNSIKKASAHTGVNFAYLMQQANVESSFKPDAKAKTSSATGLYQFIESTWLNMVKKHGDKYGMGDLADKIGSNGRVTDRETRKEILALRNDPEKASALAAEFANENKQFLKSSWGGEVGSTELYLAHFMGAGGASEFLKAKDEDGSQPAAVLFPAAAKSNRNVFYNTKTGHAKTLEEVYAFFDRKFDVKEGSLPDATKDALQGTDTAPVRDEIFSAAFIGGRKGGIGGSFSNFYSMSAPQLVADPIALILLTQLQSPDTGDSRNYF